MLCHNCGDDIPLGQRTCGTCGAADEPTPPSGKPAVFIVIEQTEVVVPREEPSTTQKPASRRQQQIAGRAFAAVAALAASPDDPGSDTGPTARSGWDVEGGSLLAQDGSRSGSIVLAVVAGVAGSAAIVGSFMVALTITSDAPIPQYLGDYGLNDVGGGTNFQFAFVLAGSLMLLGALAVRSGSNRQAERFGAGLIGGAGLAIAPLVAFMWARVDAIRGEALVLAESISLAGRGGQTFESRLAVGFFVLIGAGVVGLVALFVALGRSARDGRRPLDTTLCVLGAIAALAAAAGQLIPEQGARFVDSFSNDSATAPLLFSRLGMIAVVACGGIIGFLLASRFGLGLVIGAVSTYVWQWVTSALGAGADPAPPALGNPGSVSGAKPHIVTTVGVVAMVLIGAALALTVWRRNPSQEATDERLTPRR